MDLEAIALVGHNIVGDMKVLDRVDILNEFNPISGADTKVIVGLYRNMYRSLTGIYVTIAGRHKNECLPEGLSDLVPKYRLSYWNLRS